MKLTLREVILAKLNLHEDDTPFSYGFITRHILEGHVKVNGVPVRKPKLAMTPTDVIEVREVPALWAVGGWVKRARVFRYKEYFSGSTCLPIGKLFVERGVCSAEEYNHWCEEWGCADLKIEV